MQHSLPLVAGTPTAERSPPVCTAFGATCSRENKEGKDMARLKAPTIAPQVKLTDTDGNTIEFGNGKRTVLTFYRDPACPFCNFHLYLLTNKYHELQQYGLQFVAVFSAEPSEVKRFILARPRPFPVAAEPSYEAYNIYGIEKSFGRKLRAIFTHFVPWLRGMAKVGLLRSIETLGGVTTSNNLPADFLIDEGGKIVEAYYGKDAGDHIPFERIDYFAAKGYAKQHTKESRS